MNSGKVDAIDFNLGCPQSRARDNLFGSFLLDTIHWPKVFECIQSMSNILRDKMPLFCKIRIVEGDHGDKFTSTVDFIQGLYTSGVNLVTIHGRTRGSDKQRRYGPADVGLINEIAEYFKDKLPIISNGNITTKADYFNILSDLAPCAVGVMSGEGILANPALFTDSNTTETPDRASLFKEYCRLSEYYKDIGGWDKVDRLHGVACGETDNSMERKSDKESHQIYVARQHLVWMLGKSGHGRTIRYNNIGSKYNKHVHLKNDLIEAKTLNDLIHIANSCLVGVYESNPFQIDSNC